MCFQPSLPRLPIPNLKDTVARYLAAQCSLLDEEEYQGTRNVTDTFTMAGSDGCMLQNELVERDRRNPHTSYVAQFWLDHYMKDRRPAILLHSTSVFLSQDSRNPSQVERATNLIRSAVRFYNSLTDNQLQPDIFYKSSATDPESLQTLLRYSPSRFSSQVATLLGAIPLDMTQYSRMFATTRVPQRERDEVITAPASRHVVVMRNGHMYSVTVLDQNGSPIDPNLLYSTLSAIASNPVPPPSYPVNYLTAIDRDTWADARSELMANEQTSRALKNIESALFIVCLDDKEPKSSEELMHTLLHNYGTNRWWDKSLMLIVTRDAQVAVLGQHSCFDGGAAFNFANKVLQDTIHHPYTPPVPGLLPAQVPERANFRLTDGLKDLVTRAQTQVKEKCESLSVRVIQYSEFGSRLLKNKGLGPTSTLQLVFQIACHRLYGKFVTTVHPCSTTAFLHGRTEWVRPGTVAASECARAFQPNSGASVTDKSRLLKSAVSHCSKLTREASAGLGFDRHLFALKCIAEERGISPAIFEDPSYAKINHIVIYSAVIDPAHFSNAVNFPRSPEGISIRYTIMQGLLDLRVSSYSTGVMDDYVSSLLTVLHDVHFIVKSM